MPKEWIKIGGAREHNLKNISLEIPRDRLTVVTGPSGSGKSSLAFDTVFAEGQRKYVESLSAYARQFLDQLQKPDVDFIEGLSPAIAIEQRTSATNPRSTIATVTEIYDYLRLLYAHLGQPYCPESGEPIGCQTSTEIVDEIIGWPPKTRVMILAPIVSQTPGEFRDVLERLAREGFVRARVDGDVVELGGQPPLRLDPKKRHSIEVIVDRLVVDEKIRARLADSVETALKWGEGVIFALYETPERRGQGWEEKVLSNRLYSPASGKTYDPITPKHFSFNSPTGACPVCLGLGQELVFDPELAAPDPEKSLAQGAVAPWRKSGKRMQGYYQCLLRGLADRFGQSMDTPYKALPKSFKEVLLHGSGEEKIPFQIWRGGSMRSESRLFEGVLPQLRRLFEESQSEKTRSQLKAYMSPRPCRACGGARLKPEVLAVTLGDQKLSPESRIPGLSIMDFCGLAVEEASGFLTRWHAELTASQKQIASELVREIQARLAFLRRVGLGYLTLHRESGTLSGGESQRIRLATQIGSGLAGVLYVLDEPSIGLHQRDNDRLLESLVELRDQGNTVIVVEHDEDTIRQADYVVDLGPGAGAHGGQVVAAGTVREVAEHPRSLTGKYLRKEYAVAAPRKRIPPDRGFLEILGASEHNLKNLDARLPLGLITCVTGVSGSGKSTLIDGILRRALFRQMYGAKARPGAHREIRGAERLDKAVVIDQTPIGRTPRSNPATYTGIFGPIRDLFARLPAARIRGFGPGRFSFNVKGGRCEKCQGDGLLKIEMHFLPPLYVTCEACQGRRYNRETLEISYKGRNIADVLDMTVEEAAKFFRAAPKIYEPCLKLAEVGLGYVTLGQPGTTLSGGEAQRVKLAAELSRRSTGQTLYILDEPTTGLHFHDVSKLLEVLMKLRDAGNTLVVIEHNLEMIKTADWILDLGPEGGEGGGFVVAEGTPEQVAEAEGSHTARYLKRMLAG